MGVKNGLGIPARERKVVFLTQRRKGRKGIAKGGFLWGQGCTSPNLQAKKVQRFAKQLSEAVDPIPIIMEDERESTIDARELRLSRGTGRKKRRQRVDAEAAALFLQTYLDRNK